MRPYGAAWRAYNVAVFPDIVAEKGNGRPRVAPPRVGAVRQAALRTSTSVAKSSDDTCGCRTHRFDVHSRWLPQPRSRLYLVLGNLPHVHGHPRFLRLLRRLRIIPGFAPTNAAWLRSDPSQIRRDQALHPDQHRRSEPRRPVAAHCALHSRSQRKAACHMHRRSRILTHRNIKS